jgi:lipopolysaccharide transport system ATP-binding protein
MSKNTIIKVEGLSKQYMLNKSALQKSDTLYGNFLNGLRNVKNITQKKEMIEFWALKDVSFEIEKGARVGIIGRNGAGKSTLLKILSRITPPTKGRIEYSGRMASLLEVGTGFHGDLSGRENIYLNGSILGMTKHEIDRKFDEIVDFAEIEKFLDTPVKRYSSGMYVRLAFAIAANLESDILIVDEVLAVGDASFQKKCLGKMEQVSENEGRTVLFVSHSISTVKKLCNHGILLQSGKMLQDGDIQSIINSYEDLQNVNLNTENHLLAGYKYYSENITKEEFSIISVKLKSIDDKLIEGIYTYQGFNIETEFYSPREVELGSFNLFIKTSDDIIVLRFGTLPDQGVNFPFKKGVNKITLTIPKIPLPQGNYLVSIGLAIPMREWLLNTKEYFSLEVDENDIFNSGYHPILENSVAVTDYSWQINK